MPEIDDLINRLENENAGYPFSSDFCEVEEILKNNTISIKMLNRPGKYSSALVLGPSFPNKGTLGVVFFISNKYPVFMPLNFGIDNIVPSQKGEIVLTSNTPTPVSGQQGSSSDFVILDRTYQYFGIRSSSPSSQQYVLPSVEKKLKNIAFSWYYADENKDKSKFVPGDISIKSNTPFDTHKGHTGGNKIDCYTTLDETDVKSKYYSFKKVKKLLQLCFDNGAYLVGFYDNINQPNLIDLFPNIRSWKDHSNHFHVEFNIT